MGESGCTFQPMASFGQWWCFANLITLLSHKVNLIGPQFITKFIAKLLGPCPSLFFHRRGGTPSKWCLFSAVSVSGFEVMVSDPVFFLSKGHTSVSEGSQPGPSRLVKVDIFTIWKALVGNGPFDFSFQTQVRIFDICGMGVGEGGEIRRWVNTSGLFCSASSRLLLPPAPTFSLSRKGEQVSQERTRHRSGWLRASMSSCRAREWLPHGLPRPLAVALPKPFVPGPSRGWNVAL